MTGRANWLPGTRAPSASFFSGLRYLRSNRSGKLKSSCASAVDSGISTSAHLNRPALPFSLQRVRQLEVELVSASTSGNASCEAHLGTVERRVLLVRVPVARHALLQDRPQLGFGLVPDFQVADPLLRVSRRQSDLELETERLVHRLEEGECRVNLRLDLVDRAEDVSCSSADFLDAGLRSSPSSWTKRLTRLRPDRAPLASFRCRTPNSANRSGSSL